MSEGFDGWSEGGRGEDEAAGWCQSSGEQNILKIGNTSHSYQFHQVDSSEWAFYQASQAAFAEVSEDGVWQLLEPVMSVEVNSPNEFTSGIFSLITGR